MTWYDIEALDKKTSRIGRTSRTRDRTQDQWLDELEEQVDRLTGVTRIMMTMLEEAGAVDSARLTDAVARIDDEIAARKAEKKLQPPVSSRRRRGS